MLYGPKAPYWLSTQRRWLRWSNAYLGREGITPRAFANRFDLHTSTGKGSINMDHDDSSSNYCHPWVTKHTYLVQEGI